MTQATGKTVYVLGAGASYHTGAPLLRDFLVRARLLHEGRKPLHYKDSFGRVFQWIDKLRSSSYYVEFDLDNLEHVFSLADMSRQIGLPEGKDICSDLTRVITETLDQCQIQWKGGRFQPDEVYSEFTQRLQELNELRMKNTGQPHGVFENDAVITFNYDVMFDYAMIFHSADPHYGLGETPPPGRWPVLKMHGSVNWASCKSCNWYGVIPANLPFSPTHRLPGTEGTKVDFKMVTEVLPQKPCDHCRKTGTLSPIIIPPTWSKAVEGTLIAQVWAAAVKEIQNAFQLVVIGYSMPPTDTFFQYLLTLGLASNPRLHRVVVVNNDDSDAFKDRYKRVFARSLHDRGRLQFRKQKFDEFLRYTGGVQDIGKLID